MLTVLIPVMAGHAGRAMAVVVPPEAVSPEGETAPTELDSEIEDGSEEENPLAESEDADRHMQARQKRERTAIFIILAVLVLLCAYWWTSGKLHHRMPY
jgi:hypothetical protein